ncbi:DUF6392 family protein [Zestomonas carbonaria]|uniref:Pyocin immunity protein n=1 Tax=Zestomonas carbonaria TaxID=2762745 RepID=A0A7U7EJ19_9GAMM|nr:DUF6392 family protein [Pseudomonas carbonaria]CAD5105959.1 hypothetical protein PSEWESI4_00218 [Pseudomonas carbonaria]
MDAVTINRLIRGLGHSYEELLADSVIPNLPLKPSFDGDDNEDLIQTPEPGVELWFWVATRRLERILFTLTEVVEGESVYTGELPTPFTLNMNRTRVRATLGEPSESKGPVKIPLPGGAGGWDAYHLGKATHPNARVIAQYSGDLSVNTLAFTLVDTGHN